MGAGESWLDPVLIAVVVMVLGGLAGWAVKRRSGQREVDEGDPGYMALVRQHAASGDTRAAAAIQYKHGNKMEAFNLLARGGFHKEASGLAEELGQLKWAARHAEQAMRFKRAGDLYVKCGEFGHAARLYQRVGAFHRAAKALESDTSADVESIARLWQKACLKASSEARPGDPRGQKLVLYCARKAAEAYMHTGNHERAAFFYDMSGMAAEAEALRRQASLFPEALPSMTHDSYGSALIDLKAIGEYAALAHRGASAAPFSPPPQAPPTSPALNMQSLPAPVRPRRLTYVPTTQENPRLDAPVLEPALAQPAGPQGFDHAQAPQAHQAPQAAPEPLSARPGPFDGPAAPLAPPVQAHEAPAQAFDGGAREVVRVRDVLSDRETELPRHHGRYTLGEPMGQGRVGSTVKAFDNTIKRAVVLKFFPQQLAENPEAMAFFEREVRVASSVMHVNLVEIHSFGVMEERPFVALEFVDGEPLEEHLHDFLRKGWGMPVGEVIRVARGILSALAAVHQRGLVHRDVKPGNVMIARGGRVKLMDIGILRSADPARNRGPGITCYLASEQLRGDQGDHRSDLFALGVTLYELLTGRLPYETQERAFMPAPARHYRPEIPEVLDEIIWRCLQLEADARPSSASELLLRLDGLDADEEEEFIEDLEPLDELPEANPLTLALTMSLDQSLRDYVHSNGGIDEDDEDDEDEPPASNIIQHPRVTSLQRLASANLIDSSPSFDTARR